ncbi:calcium-binding protein [Aliigemmobacter aestuarii]|nr:calcium-binding protein [Gemmobacter aestuarii]
MTTFTLRGIGVVLGDNGATRIGTAQLNIVVPSASTTFNYSVTDPGGGYPEVEVSGRILDGAVGSSIAPGFTLYDLDRAQFSETYISRISWSGGVTTVLSIEVEQRNQPTQEFYFVLDGPSLPRFTTARAFEQFADSVRPIGAGTGALAPGTVIPWRSIDGVLINEDDEFYGTPRGDNQSGGIGDDYFNSSRGNDTFRGGIGEDQVSFAFDPRGVTANLAAGRAVDGWGNTDRLLSIEMLRGSSHDDLLIGNGGQNAIRGLEGNDTLNGRGGIDTVRYDRDLNYGGNTGVTVSLKAGRATDGFGNTDRLLNFENVLGSDRSDRLIGNNGANVLNGMGGNDLLRGLAGRDHLMGGRGSDRLDGGAGADRLQGDQGNDAFIFRGSFGNDRILDFGTGADRIDLRGVTSITSFNDLARNHLAVSGENLRITDGNGNSILLLGVERSDLSADDFLF